MLKLLSISPLDFSGIWLGSLLLIVACWSADTLYPHAVASHCHLPLLDVPCPHARLRDGPFVDILYC